MDSFKHPNQMLQHYMSQTHPTESSTIFSKWPLPFRVIAVDLAIKYVKKLDPENDDIPTLHARLSGTISTMGWSFDRICMYIEAFGIRINKFRLIRHMFTHETLDRFDTSDFEYFAALVCSEGARPNIKRSQQSESEERKTKKFKQLNGTLGGRDDEQESFSGSKEKRGDNLKICRIRSDIRKYMEEYSKLPHLTRGDEDGDEYRAFRKKFAEDGALSKQRDLREGIQPCHQATEDTANEISDTTDVDDHEISFDSVDTQLRKIHGKTYQPLKMPQRADSEPTSSTCSLTPDSPTTNVRTETRSGQKTPDNYTTLRVLIRSNSPANVPCLPPAPGMFDYTTPPASVPPYTVPGFSIPSLLPFQSSYPFGAPMPTPPHSQPYRAPISRASRLSSTVSVRLYPNTPFRTVKDALCRMENLHDGKHELRMQNAPRAYIYDGDTPASLGLEDGACLVYARSDDGHRTLDLTVKPDLTQKSLY